MAHLTDTLLLLVLLTNFAVLAASRLTFTIRAAAAQGILLGLLPLAIHHPWTGHSVVITVGTLAVKGLLLPSFLMWAIREAAVRREVEPSLGPLGSIAAGVLAIGVSLALSAGLPSIGEGIPPLLVATSFATMMIGFVVLTTRRKAMTQVVGYLLLENGVYLFGLAVSARVPFMVEMGVLLDLVVGVFIMGLVVFHMNRELDSLDSDRLTELRD
ncbi:MAG: NADH-quinone oxidoreductase subunit K [Candidatus Eisenbacteria bacterium]